MQKSSILIDYRCQAKKRASVPLQLASLLSELIFEQNLFSFIDLWTMNIMIYYGVATKPNRKLYYKTATTRYKSFCKNKCW